MKFSKNLSFLLSALLLSDAVYASSPALSGIFASANDADTIASNPAGMSNLEEGSHLEAQFVTIVSIDKFDVDQGQSTDGGNPDNDYFPKAIPSIYYVNSLGEDWRYGITVNIPSGFGSTNGNSWAGRYYSDSFSLFYVSIAPAVSYRVNEQLSLGVSLNATYASSSTTTRINNDLLDPGTDDGKFEFSAGAFGFSGSLSMLYEFTDQTRIGLVYAGKSEADLKDDLHFRNLGPNTQAVLEASGLKDSKLKVTNVMPQRVQAGIYHEMDGGNFFTVDTMWIDFSEFATGNIELDGDRLDNPDGIYDDLWALSAGYGFPVDKMTYKFGAFYLSSAVDDDKRTVGLRLDRIIGVGAGFTRQLENDREIDVNLNIINTGEGKVDTGDSLARGRVVGESNTPYSFALDIAYHW